MAKDKGKTYWKGIEERDRTPEFLENLENEFPEPLPLDELLNSAQKSKNRFSRRSFLKASGFSLAAAIVSACSRGKVEKAIPLLNRQEQSLPGKAFWYASTCHGCQAACGILVKNRDGRPIKIEGNDEHPLSQGGVCAIGQAMVLGLYDEKRLQNPLLNGQQTDWNTIDRYVQQKLKDVDKPVYFLSASISSPTKRYWIAEFLKSFKNSKHIQYDALSYSAILNAHKHSHGVRVLPAYHFDKAQVIVGLDADFLGTWLSPVEFTVDYGKTRRLNDAPPSMSYHVQFEGRLSLTGANADERFSVNSYQLLQVALYLLHEVSLKIGQSTSFPLPDLKNLGVSELKLKTISNQLLEGRGKSLIVCGVNDLRLQFIVNHLNQILGNYEQTLSLRQPALQWQSNEQEVQQLLEAMEKGQIGALFIDDSNPVYSFPEGQRFARAMKNVSLLVNFNDYLDETAEHCQVVAAKPHFLEIWDDAEPQLGILSLTQPLIKRLGNTRTLSESLAAWSGKPESDYQLMRMVWQKDLFPLQKQFKSFDQFWDHSVEKGVAYVNRKPVMVRTFNPALPENLDWSFEQQQTHFELILYPKISMFDGTHAQNPWLQELPDPITKATWDNYLCISPITAKKLNIEQGDVVKISNGQYEVEMPALLQPGQHEQVLAVAVGYGRKGTERFYNIGPDWIEKRPTVPKGEQVGKNVFPFARWNLNTMNYLNQVSLNKTGQKYIIAQTQTHHTLTVPELGGEMRDLVRETTFAQYQKNPGAGNKKLEKILQLWPEDHVYTGHHWAMVIDLSKCTGCSACVISCQAENNVPVVGKDEVYRQREMHWLRIDRYYSGNDKDVEVVHQPVMCHHCDHAPCENVCPVLATLHSEEGINQQIYNRCVGTRYCANNCPYKVRRFNWFDYWKRDKKENLVLNPDITVRTRGVMEKCSLCVQRIQEAKIEAKRQGRPLKDGEIKLACEQSCPAGAIVFGDMNDPESRVSKLIEHPRHYRMLEEFNFRPTVGYLTVVRNKKVKTTV